MRHLWPVLACTLFPAALSAETLILKDGAFVEGRILRQTSRSVHMETRFGSRTYARDDIEQIVESVDPLDPSSVDRFDQLAAPIKTVLNAQVDYALGRYEQALARLTTLGRNAGNPAIRLQVDWLTIDLKARLGEWDAVVAALKVKRSAGTPPERIRAEAYLAILDANPERDLRYVGTKHVRNFIRSDDMLAKARAPNALRDPMIMRRALEQYCEHLLVEDRLSVVAFGDRLDPASTYEAVRAMSGLQTVSSQLPYLEDLKHAEAALDKARAILDDYGGAFELDLVRTELNHLLPVLDQLIRDAVEVSPAHLDLTIDRRSGRLAAESQVLWRTQCDKFVEVAEPARSLVEYMVERVDAFPNGLRDMRKELTAVRGRLAEMIKAAKKARSRSRA